MNTVERKSIAILRAKKAVVWLFFLFIPVAITIFMMSEKLGIGEEYAMFILFIYALTFLFYSGYSSIAKCPMCNKINGYKNYISYPSFYCMHCGYDFKNINTSHLNE